MSITTLVLTNLAPFVLFQYLSIQYFQFPKMTKRALEIVPLGQRRRYGLWSATTPFVFVGTSYYRHCLKVCAPLMSSLMNSSLSSSFAKRPKFVSLGQRRRHGLWSAASTQDSSSLQQLGFNLLKDSTPTLSPFCSTVFQKKVQALLSNSIIHPNHMA